MSVGCGAVSERPHGAAESLKWGTFPPAAAQAGQGPPGAAARGHGRQRPPPATGVGAAPRPANEPCAHQAVGQRRRWAAAVVGSGGGGQRWWGMQVVMGGAGGGGPPR